MDKNTIKQAYKRGYENAAVKIAQYFNAGAAQRAASAQRMGNLNQVPHSWDVAGSQARQNYDRIARGNLLNAPVGTIRQMRQRQEQQAKQQQGQQQGQPGQQNSQQQPGQQQSRFPSIRPYQPRYAQNGEHTGIYVNGVEWKRGQGQNQAAMMEQKRLSNEDWANDRLAKNPNDPFAKKMLASTGRMQRQMQQSGMYTPESQKQVGMKQVAPKWNDANISKAIDAYRNAKTSGNADEMSRIKSQFQNYYSSLDPKYQQAFKDRVRGLAQPATAATGMKPTPQSSLPSAPPPKPQVPATPGPVQ